MIVKKTKQITKEVCKEPARIQYEDTGRFDVRTEIDVNGVQQVVEVPIKRKVLIDAVFETIVEEVEVYEIESHGEAHEFASMNEAREFAKVLKGAK